MTQASVKELIHTWRPRYLRAGRKEKIKILDEFVALTGYHRKAAIRPLRKGRKLKQWDRRGRPRIYANEVKPALTEVWEICGQTCSKRLAPFLVGGLDTHQPVLNHKSSAFSKAISSPCISLSGIVPR